ncbi:MAG TPA: glycosyltransferase family 9 protein [Candidatus Sulfopaludibacter sp.]|nr:glycosyltransferase family 9 protein [Candidatus Sulfopaludibacter sp.]
MNQRENILVFRLKSMGDVLFTLPAIHALRENFPDAQITFLSSRENAPLLRGFREVDRIIALDRAILFNPLRAGPEVFRLLHQLWRAKFSLTVDFQGYGETAWLSWWSGAPTRWGSVYSRGREWLYTHGVRRDEQIHLADWNLSLLRQCGLRLGEISNEFVLPTDALAEARQFFADNRLDPARPTLFLQPFTSTPHKNWPLVNFLALARHFQSRGVQIIFGGGPADRGALEPPRAMGFVISAGTPLLVSGALTKLSRLTVGGDTGLLHLAVAMKKRVLMLMTVTGQTYPYQQPDWAITPLQGTGLAGMPVAQVVPAVEQALSESSGSASC